jgi:glycosyltransferase involved in cell wall biosynthesis
MSRPRVSVITIFFDEERFLAEAIESVRMQTFSNWELILVDDGSRDGSSAIARSRADSDPARIRCFRHPGSATLGMSASRNLGLAHARGELVAFLDGDDVWVPEKLAEQIEIMDANPRAGLVYGRTLIWHGWQAKPATADFHYPLGVEPDRLYEPPVLFNVLMHNRAQTPTTCNAMMRRTLIERVGGFVDAFTGMFEDQVFFAKALLAGPAYVDHRTWAKYRQHDESCSGQDPGGARELRARLRFLSWLRSYVAARGTFPASARIAMTRAVLDTRLRIARATLRSAFGTVIGGTKRFGGS